MGFAQGWYQLARSKTQLRRVCMLELIASFLIILAAISLVMGYSLTGLIYACLVMSIIITLVGTLRGRPQQE